MSSLMEIDSSSPVKHAQTTAPLPTARMEGLQRAIELAIQQTLKKVSFEAVSKCFPKLAQESPEILKSAHAQLLNFLRESMLEEFHVICEQRDLETKLQELDRLVEEARLRNSAGNQQRVAPELAIRAASLPIKQAEVTRLQTQIQELEADTTVLIDKVDANYKFIQETEASIREVQEAFAKALQATSKISVKKLQDTIFELTASEK